MQIHIVMLKNEIISVCGDEQTAKWEKEMVELNGNDDVVIKKYGVVSYDQDIHQRNLKAYISMQNSYKCDKKAAEWLEDDSICILENNKIRKVRSSDNPDSNVYVHVNNLRKETDRERFIKEGEYVRYEIVRSGIDGSMFKDEKENVLNDYFEKDIETTFNLFNSSQSIKNKQNKE